MLFSDTTMTLENKFQLISTKNDYTTKIHYITGNYAIGCSSPSSPKINALVTYLREQIPEGTPLMSRIELYSLLYDKLIPSFCGKERQITETIYGEKTDIYRPIEIDALFAARLKDNSHILYKIRIYVTDYTKSKADDTTDITEVKFGAVGTGSDVIEPILNQTMRIIEKKGYSIANWSKKLTALYCHLLMNFASSSDALTGPKVMGAFIRGSRKDFPDNPSTWITDYVSSKQKPWQEFLIEGLKEMPEIMRQIPFDRLSSLRSVSSG
jgi:hypothetical protein